jgi:hypothetical protein
MPESIVIPEELIEEHFEAAGLPASVAPAVWQAIEAAGYQVTSAVTGEPVTVNLSTIAETVSVDGMPGAFVKAIKIGERGWIVWIAIDGKDGAVQTLGPMFLAGGGDLLRRAKTTGRWTVGASLVAGPDKVT